MTVLPLPFSPASRRAALRTAAQGTLQAGLLLVAGLALATSSAAAQTSRNAAAAAPDSPYHGQVVEDIVARVNGQVISTSDYDHAAQDLETQGRQRNISSADIDEQRKQLLRDLIDNQLLLSKGKQLGITGEADTVRQLDELRKQNNLDSMDALEKAAEQQGVNFADFRASIQNRVITSQVIRQEVGSRINITQGDEQRYYDEHKDQFQTPEAVKLSEILLPTADPDNAAQVAEAQTKADAVEAALKGGKSFEDEAKSSSGGSTAAQGGALGDFKRGQLAKVLEDATFTLQPGQYSAPIRTKQGFVILKVDDHQAGGQQAFAAVQPQVEEAVGMQRMQPALRQYLTRLREEAFIDVKPGYVDAGASRDETRPIFSAYQPPQPKKKKKEVRTRFASGGGRTRNAVLAARNKSAAPSPATPALPANVPSLADVPGGTAAGSPASANAAGGGAAPATAAVIPPPTSPAAAKPTQTASANTKTEKPGKREKVRFGQAPRETLPASTTRETDAGASTANGNTSNTETASLADTQNGSSQANLPTGAHYETGESATEQQDAAKKTKTRFSQRGETRAQKAEKKRLAKIDPYPTAPPDSQEIADKKVQDQPLGLQGDTSKAPPKPKPTGKTRYSDEAGKKNSLSSPGNPGADNGNGSTQQPTVQTQPYQEPSPQRSPGTDPPVNTQTTPTGTGDPLGQPTPGNAPETTQPQAPQR